MRRPHWTDEDRQALAELDCFYDGLMKIENLSRKARAIILRGRVRRGTANLSDEMNLIAADRTYLEHASLLAKERYRQTHPAPGMMETAMRGGDGGRAIRRIDGGDEKDHEKGK